jgi:PAS domain S-box-containing protein
MARPKIAARDQERPFLIDELFFSITDLKGVIKSGNDVFARVSGYNRVEELIDKPHNIIRHPDMPRSVFKLLWDFLHEGKVFAGYVKNMATDGCYYWVMALVVPIKNGYLSVRFKPSSPYLSIVKEIYAELLSIEKEGDNETGAWKQTMVLAGERLNTILKERGFLSYESFMHTALATELANRRKQISLDTKQQVIKYSQTSTNVIGSAKDIVNTLNICETVDQQLDHLFTQVDTFLELIQKLNAKSSFLLDLADNIHDISVNTLIISCKLNSSAGGLAVVSESLATISKESTHAITEITELLSLSSPLRKTAFAITAAKLQVEMAIFFAKELIKFAQTDDLRSESMSRTQEDLKILVDSFSSSTERMIETLKHSQNSVSQLISLHEDLNTALRKLSRVHVTGKVQSAYITKIGLLKELFDQIYEQLHIAREELKELADGIPFLESHLPKFEKAGYSVQQTLKAMRATANNRVDQNA